MKYILSLFSGALLYFFMSSIFFPGIAYADIRINEIAWMGTAASQYSEWIELYNSGADAVSLAGWKLYKTGGELFFTLSKTIAAEGYLLVERTTASAPDAVPGINDESGTFNGGGLRNSGEDLSLKDKDGNIIENLPFASGWPAGDAKTKDTMQWDGSKWITAPGTPDTSNATASAAAVSTVPATQSSEASDLVINPDPTPAITAPVTEPDAPQTVVPSDTPATTTPPDPVTTVSPNEDTTVPSPTIANTDTATTVTTPVPVTNKIATPIKAVSKTAKSKTATVNKKTTVKSSSTATSDGKDTAANDAAADQMQSSPVATPKENSRTKIIILAAVALIGMALFLLLERFKTSKE